VEQGTESGFAGWEDFQDCFRSTVNGLGMDLAWGTESGFEDSMDLRDFHCGVASSRRCAKKNEDVHRGVASWRRGARLRFAPKSPEGQGRSLLLEKYINNLYITINVNIFGQINPYAVFK
jgi:hypothetical protein